MGDIAILNEKVSWLGLLERFPLNNLQVLLPSV